MVSLIAPRRAEAAGGGGARVSGAGRGPCCLGSRARR
ncbi:hypothetical protein [Terrabacter terrigena]|uniref:Uncharacterized protein n=1 Tax=Terrabacter terrigena TaxID=574718 RepID=A0ABW3MXZ1_9MICO